MASFSNLTMPGALSRPSLLCLLLHKLKSPTRTDLIVLLYSFENCFIPILADIRVPLCSVFGNVLQTAVAVHLVSMVEKGHDDISAHFVDIIEVS